MDFSICKAEVSGLFMFVLLLTLFMGQFKNPQELPWIWNNICTNYSTAFELTGCERASGVKGTALGLAYSSLAPSHMALKANKLFSYSVASACPGTFKHGDSSCKVRLFRNT